MTNERPKIDRSYYNSPEFKERLERSAEAAMNDPEYQKEISLWNGSANDQRTPRNFRVVDEQLKAELAQALADNQRLRDGLDEISERTFCYYPNWCDACNEPEHYKHEPSGAALIAKQALSNPLPTGIGAAMLRMVKAAKYFDTLIEDPEKVTALEIMVKWQTHVHSRVQALKELEGE